MDIKKYKDLEIKKYKLRDRNYYMNKDFVVNMGFGFVNDKKYNFSKNGYKKIKELNNMDYRSKFFIVDDSVNDKSKKKINEIINMKRNIDEKILELEYYNRVLDKELNKIG